MFRFTTEIKGLVIDLDSISEPLDKWAKFNIKECLFVTTDDEKKKYLEEVYHAVCYLVTSVDQNLMPNIMTHVKALQLLGIKSSELVYVSGNYEFIHRALCFSSGTIWIEEKVPAYHAVGDWPDLKCKNVDTLHYLLETHAGGYIGEEQFDRDVSVRRAAYISVNLHCGGDSIPVYALGRYFGTQHYMNPVHPFSCALLLNKREGSKCFGIFNGGFGRDLSKLVGLITDRRDGENTYDCVCSVPTKKSRKKRFTEVTQIIASENALEDISDRFITVKDYQSQKGLTESQRIENISRAFQYQSNLSGKRIILIDDIITTGSTIKECYRTLKSAGAVDVLVIVMGINQLGQTYCFADQPVVQCPDCNSGMRLLYNSSTKEAFYACQNHECGKTKTYAAGKRELLDKIDQQFIDFDDTFVDDADELY